MATAKPVSPREQWVLDAPDGYVIRRYILGEGWRESEMMTREEVSAGAEALPRSCLVYAVRLQGEDKHIALAESTAPRAADVAVGPMINKITNVGFAILQATFPESKKNHIVARAIAAAVQELLDKEVRSK